ncbi:MAG: hypothetical protein JW808_08020 [Victivallales bacterium]|nr:hypothetical protein [Victivallales bacterium]
MKVAYTKAGNDMYGPINSEILECCLCGEQDYEKLYVHRLGMAIGMRGDDYTFCAKCWHSRTLGKKLLELLRYPHGAVLQKECLNIREVKP